MSYERMMRPVMAAGLLCLGAGAASAGVALENFLAVPLTDSRAMTVNGRGDIAGAYIRSGSVPASPRVGAFSYISGSGLRDLGSLGGMWTEATAINQHGVVVGWGFQNGLTRTRAFRWTPDQGIRLIPGLEGVDCTAVAVNANGAVAGARTVDSASQAFRFSDGAGVQLLGSLTSGELALSWASGINNLGHVTGWSFTSSGEVRAFRFADGQGIRDLGHLGGGMSQATAISDDGKVVGWSKNGAGKLRAFIYEDGRGMRDLGDLGGGVSQALSVNDFGTVVGWSLTADGAEHAFVWSEADGMLDLTNIVSLSEPYLLTSATGVGPGGQISGVAVPITGDQSHSFAVRLDLRVQEAPTGDLNGDVRVNSSDLSVLLTYISTSDSRGDLNGDARVDFDDVRALFANWTG